MRALVDSSPRALDDSPEPRPLERVRGGLSRFSSGSAELDGLLGGGWAHGCTVVVHGPGGAGKTTWCFAWVPLRPLLVVSLEMPDWLLRETAVRSGADLSRVDFIERLDTRAADSVSARALIVDSLHETGDPVGALDLVRAWVAGDRQRFAVAIAHETKAGDAAGPSVIRHRNDGLFRIIGHDGQRVRVSVRKSRFCRAGSKLVSRVKL